MFFLQEIQLFFKTLFDVGNADPPFLEIHAGTIEVVGEEAKILQIIVILAKFFCLSSDVLNLFFL